MAGDANPVDSKAASAVPPLPPIDSQDVWSLVTGVNKTSPRTVLPVDTQTILVGNHKLILTDPEGPHGVFVHPAGWTSPAYPNRSSLLPHRDAGAVVLNCSLGCLFNVVLDPEERHELMASEPGLAAELRAQLAVLKKGFFQNHDGPPACIRPDWTPGWWGTSCACYVAAHVHGDNASGPWLGPYGN